MRLNDNYDNKSGGNLKESPEASQFQLRKRRKRSKGVYILGALGIIAVLLLIVYLGTYVYQWTEQAGGDPVQASGDALGITDQEERSYTQEELDTQVKAAAEEARRAALAEESDRILGGIEARLSGGDTVVETLRPYYPEDIVLASGGRYHFVPIREDLKKHSLVQEKLTVLENGEFQYLDGEKVISHKGIDVSQHQGEIDWQKVAEDGVEFVFIRVGYRGYGTGKMMLDEQFENNIKGAVANGIKAGVYFFSQAVNEQEAQEEAAFVLEQIAPYKLECPVVFDVEKVSDKDGRMNLITVEERTNVTLAFLEAIEAAGYPTMIYHNMEMGVLLIDLERLEGYDKWFAYYGDQIYYPYDFQVWQYSESGTVNGISGPVDLNISFKMWENT